MPQYTVDDLEGYLHAVRSLSEKFGGIWWRGHDDAAWKLQTTQHRDKISRASDANASQHFRRQAGQRSTNLPDWENTVAWLQLARHYGLRTRILDWTESALVALFFALEREDEKDENGKKRVSPDAAVWALEPQGLNQAQTSERTIYAEDEPPIVALALPSFDASKVPAAHVLAFYGSEIDPRMMLQVSAFTIHGPDSPLEALPQASGSLAKITIAKAGRPKVWRDVRLLGMRRSTLFPDLANLAHDLNLNM